MKILNNISKINNNPKESRGPKLLFNTSIQPYLLIEVSLSKNVIKTAYFADKEYDDSNFRTASLQSISWFQ